VLSRRKSLGRRKCSSKALGKKSRVLLVLFWVEWERGVGE
jgi:hypothetical protein